MELRCKMITKRYGNVKAVNGVNCVMGKGVYGLLGVNGAGKTTLMRMLCTIIQPTEGEILWNGRSVWELGTAYRDLLGYLPQDFGYYPDLSVRDYMLYIASIKGLRAPYAKKKMGILLRQVGMEDIPDAEDEAFVRGYGAPRGDCAGDVKRPEDPGAGRADGRAGSQ